MARAHSLTPPPVPAHDFIKKIPILSLSLPPPHRRGLQLPFHSSRPRCRRNSAFRCCRAPYPVPLACPHLALLARHHRRVCHPRRLSQARCWRCSRTPLVLVRPPGWAKPGGDVGGPRLLAHAIGAGGARTPPLTTGSDPGA